MSEQGSLSFPGHTLTLSLDPATMERMDEEPLAESSIRRTVEQLMEVSIDLEDRPFRELDMLGLVDVAVALSKWRDHLG